MPTFRLRIEHDYYVSGVITNYKVIEVEAATLEEAWDQGKKECLDVVCAEDWDDFDVKLIDESSRFEENIHLLNEDSHGSHPPSPGREGWPFTYRPIVPPLARTIETVRDGELAIGLQPTAGLPAELLGFR
jgi:hypothetical protein